MPTAKIHLRFVLGCLVACVVTGSAAAPRAFAESAPDSIAAMLIDWAGCDRGICLHVGADDGQLTGELLQQGAFLVVGLEPDADRVETARRNLASRYGAVTVRECDLEKLPYAENMLNLIIIDNVLKYGLPAAEIFRVLRPSGVAIVGQSDVDGEESRRRAERLLRETGGDLFEIREQDGVWAKFVKPQPAEIDQWTHARYDATGNAVSADTVSSPPRRIRWIAGPLRSPGFQISAGGRNFYAGILARDAFNGLQLWSRPISPMPLGGADPVASEELLFVVHEGKLQAWDAASGETVRVYDGAGTPVEVCRQGDVLVTIDGSSVRALNVETGKLLWRRSASIPGCTSVSDDAVFFVRGNPRRGEKCEILRLDLATGAEVWRQGKARYKPDPADHNWLDRATKIAYHDGLLAVETSTYSDFAEGNEIHVLSALDGSYLCGRSSEPGGHFGQARALFVDGLLWTRDERATEGMDPRTGEILQSFGVGTGHCFPPVATPNYMIAGEMHFTDLTTGDVDAMRISKGSCDRSTGFVPANGLVYVAPKNCVCWPMLKGFLALAPERLGGSDVPSSEVELSVKLESAAELTLAETDTDSDAWPCYRGDAWRSGSTTGVLPTAFETKWTRPLGTVAAGYMAEDWEHNPFVRGPVTAPVVANGKLLVARPDAHEVLALDSEDGSLLWRRVADGRIDSPPTLCGELCLFGTRGGWVYCLQVDTGELVWRMHTVADDEQIVSFGQTESPWPVAGSILVVDRTAYIAAGRQYLAEGGVRFHAVDVATGRLKWSQCVDDLPGHHYYAAAGLEFDNYDLMVREGSRVAMSRWLFDTATGDYSVQPKSGFAHYVNDGTGVIAPRGHWSYGPRMGRSGDRIVRRPLLAFRGNTLIGSTEDRSGLFRRDFAADECEMFEREWYSYRAVSGAPENGTEENRTERMMQGAAWSIGKAANSPIDAMILAGEHVYCATESGELLVVSTADGRNVSSREITPVVWDGMAAVDGRLYLATKTGDVVCLHASSVTAP